jgi:Zn finger protein HypA/HybF involved in hydrogenase expression
MPRATVYQRLGRRLIDLYDINEAVPRKAPTEKQLIAIKNARAAFTALCTCTECGQVFNSKLANGICEFCKRAKWLERIQLDTLQ